MALQSLDVGDTCHRKYELARHMPVQLPSLLREGIIPFSCAL